MKAIKIPTSGAMSIVDLDEPLFLNVSDHLCGFMEIIRIPRLGDDIVMLVNDCGKLMNLDWNLLATQLYGAPDVIVGPVLLMKEGITEDGLDIVGLDNEDIKCIRAKLGGLRFDV